MAEEMTRERFTAGLREQYGPDAAQVGEQINRWLARGDGVAIYENHDLGHPEMGDWRPVSFGSPAALLEITDAADLPDRLPDTPQLINWRYTLIGTYRGELLNLYDLTGAS